MKIDDFLSRLEGVRRTGSGWLARCPAHDDRSPSLRVSEGDDGKILVHCFAQCPVEDVLGNVGVLLSDLMPDSAPSKTHRRSRIPAGDVLRALSFHAKVVAIAACDMAKGKTLTEDEKNALLDTAAAIDEALRMTESA